PRLRVLPREHRPPPLAVRHRIRRVPPPPPGRLRDDLGRLRPGLQSQRRRPPGRTGSLPPRRPHLRQGDRAKHALDAVGDHPPLSIALALEHAGTMAGELPEVHYVRAGEVDIAYQVVG